MSNTKVDMTRVASKSVVSNHDIVALASEKNFDLVSGFEPKKGHIYTVTRAISARVNQNFDGFPSEELKKAYKTFLGKPVFVNHANEDPNRTRGRIVGCRYVENGNDKYIEVIQEVNAQKFPKLAKELIEGGLDSVSMGCSAERTICSYCGNEAVGMFDMCAHVLNSKGRELPAMDGSGKPVLVYEECRDLGFFELSYVFDPADETAVVSTVLTAAKKHADRTVQAVNGTTTRVWCDLPGCRRWTERGGESYTNEWVQSNGTLRTFDYCCDGHREQFEDMNPSWAFEAAVRNPVKAHMMKAFGEVEAPPTVDTLRSEGDEETEDFHRYVESPAELGDPDLEKAKDLERMEAPPEGFEQYDDIENDLDAENPLAPENPLDPSAPQELDPTEDPDNPIAPVNLNEDDEDPAAFDPEAPGPEDEAGDAEFVKEGPVGDEVPGLIDEAVPSAPDPNVPPNPDEPPVPMNEQAPPETNPNAPGVDDAVAIGDDAVAIDPDKVVEDPDSDQAVAVDPDAVVVDEDVAPEESEEKPPAEEFDPTAPGPEDEAGSEENSDEEDAEAFDPEEAGPEDAPSEGVDPAVVQQTIEQILGGEPDPQEDEVAEPKRTSASNRSAGRRNSQSNTSRRDSNMGNNSLAQRGRVASRGRVADQSRNDQGEQEEVFLTQTPPEEGVVAPTGDESKINNTEESLVARIKADRQKLIELRSRRAERRIAFSAGDKVTTSGDPTISDGQTGTVQSVSDDYVTVDFDGNSQQVKPGNLHSARKLFRADETATEVNPEQSGTDEELKGEFESADPNDGVEETQPKDAAKHQAQRRYRQFSSWCRAKHGKRISEAENAGELRRWARSFANEAKIDVASIYPVLRNDISALRKRAADEDEGETGSKAELPEEFKEQQEKSSRRKSAADDKPDWLDDKIDGDDSEDDKKESSRRRRGRGTVARRKTADDDKLDVAAPDGRVDVEAPTSGTTDDEAQESQFDKHDFGDNAGDDLADPDLSTDQNFAPGEGKTSRVKKASGLAAVRLAEAMITAGLDRKNEGRWALSNRFTEMSAAVVSDRTALLESVIEANGLGQPSERKTAGIRGASAARRSPVPQNMSAPRSVAPAAPAAHTAGAEIGNPDSDLFD